VFRSFHMYASMAFVLFLSSTLVFSAASASTTLVEQTVTVGGYTCPGPQTAWVVRPDDTAKHPLISFAHGYGSGGDDGVKQYYTQVIRSLAGLGYVVVALESANGRLPCISEYKDQLHSLEWALANVSLKAHIDIAAGSALVGQSMGGGSTVLASSQAEAVKKYNIKTAAAIHPCLGPCFLQLSAVEPKVPILFLTGDKDDTVSPDSVYEQYNKTASVEKVFVEVQGADHCNCCDMSNRKENPYIYDWINCKMKLDASACARVTTCAEPNLRTSGHGCHYDAGIAKAFV